MAPLFGGGGDDDGQQAIAAIQAEVGRLDALPLEQLAAEVMITGFGPDGPGGPGKPGTLEDVTTTDFSRVGPIDIARRFSSALSRRAVGGDLIRRLVNLVAEGLQVLENAALIRVTWQGGQAHYMATRRGRRAVEENALGQALAVHRG